MFFPTLMEIVVKVGHERRSWPSAAATALPNSEVAKHVPIRRY